MCNSLHNNGLHFNVYSLKNASELCISIVPQGFSKHVCYNTQAMPLFQVLNFLYVTSESRVFELASSFLENLWNPAIDCTCNSSIQKNL
jgi:hypothetical protein